MGRALPRRFYLEEFFEDEVDDILTLERAGFAEDGFISRIPLAQVVEDFAVLAVELIAGEGAGGLADVLFRVISFTEGEELHDLTGKILIGSALF